MATQTYPSRLPNGLLHAADELANRAKLVNAFYCGIAPTDEAAIEHAWHGLDVFPRISSMASACYLPVEAARSRRGVGEEELARIEHRRWTAFHLAIGFNAMSRSTLEQRYSRARGGNACWRRHGRSVPVDMSDREQCGRYARCDGPDCMGCGWEHLCLVPWDRLDETSRWYAALDSKLSPRDFKQADRDVVRLVETFGDAWLQGEDVAALALIEPDDAMRAFVRATWKRTCGYEEMTP